MNRPREGAQVTHLSEIIADMSGPTQWRVVKQLYQVASKWTSQAAEHHHRDGEGEAPEGSALAQVEVASPEVVAGDDIDELYHAFRHAARKNDNSWKKEFLGEAELAALQSDLDTAGISSWLEERIDASVEVAVSSSPKPPPPTTSQLRAPKKSMGNIMQLDAAAAFRNITDLLQPRTSNALSEAARKKCPHCHRLPALNTGENDRPLTPTIDLPFANKGPDAVRTHVPHEILSLVDHANALMWREVVDMYKRSGPVDDISDTQRAKQLESAFEALLVDDADICRGLEKLQQGHANKMRTLETKQHKDRKLLEQARMELRADEQELAELEKELGVDMRDNIQTLCDMESTMQKLDDDLYLVNSAILDAEIQRKVLKKELAKAQWSSHGCNTAKTGLMELLEVNGVGSTFIQNTAVSCAEPLPGVVVRYCDEILERAQKLSEMEEELSGTALEELAADGPVLLRVKLLARRLLGGICGDCGHFAGSCKYCPQTGASHELALEDDESQKLFSLVCVDVQRELPLISEMEPNLNSSFIRRKSTLKNASSVRKRALSMLLYRDEGTTALKSPRDKKIAGIESEMAQSILPSHAADDDSDDSEKEYESFGRPLSPKKSTVSSVAVKKDSAEAEGGGASAAAPSGPLLDHSKLSTAAAHNLVQIFIKELRNTMSGDPLRDSSLVQQYKKALVRQRGGANRKAPRYKLSHGHLANSDVAEQEGEVVAKIDELLSQLNSSVPTVGVGAGKPEGEGVKHADPSGQRLPPISKAAAAQGIVSPEEFAALYFQEEILKVEADRMRAMLAVAHVPLKDLLAQAVELEHTNEELQIQLKVVQEQLVREGGDASAQ